MKEAYLIIDSSTESIRAYAMDPKGDVLGSASESLQNLRDGRYPDALYFEPDDNQKKLIRVCRRALEGISDISITAVSASSQREGVVLMDKSGKALIGFPNIDNRGMEWEEEYQDKHGIYLTSGRWRSTLFSALKLVGMREKDPELWTSVDKVLSISGWIAFLLSGEMACEPSHAGETQLFNVRTNQWSEQLCETFDIPLSFMPSIIKCGTKLGVLRKETADLIGLEAGIPVIAGGADTQLAIESCTPKTGDMVIVAGTTSPSVRLMDHFIEDPEERCWVNRHVRDDLFVIETNVGVSGANYDRAVRLFYPESGYEKAEEEMAMCDGSRCLASVGSMIFHKGKITPRGGFVIDTPLRDSLTRADLTYAVLMDYAFSFKTNYDANNAVTGETGGRLYGCGGGFKGKILPQLMADMTGRKIEVQKGYDHATCSGLVKMINRYFKKDICASETVSVITPKRNLSDYPYESWAAYRELLNP